MERQHDAEHGSQQADVGGVRRHGPDHDQVLRERHFEFLLGAKTSDVHTSKVQPSFRRDGNRPKAQADQEPDDAVVNEPFETLHLTWPPPFESHYPFNVTTFEQANSAPLCKNIFAG